MQRLITFLSAKSTAARQDLTLLAITFGLLTFQFLGRYPLLEPDEGRYAEIPREMLARADFITPTLNYVKYFEKPPLLYWLNAFSFTLFGQNEFAARLPCALAGLLVILFTYWLGRRLFDRRTGLYAAIITGTGIGFIALARIVLTDMPLTLCLTVSLGSVILAIRSSGRERSGYFYLAYGAAALAVLAKGLIGIVFPAAIIFLFLLLRRRWRLLLEMRLISGLGLFLLIAAPWFVLVSLRNPEFARFFFIHEHFERFLTKVHQRYEPFWYFFPVLAGVMLPWSVFIPAALKNAWQRRREEEGEALAYLSIWALFIFLFFSKSDSKLIPYILPVVPPLALLIAAAFRERLDRGKRLQRTLGVALGTVVLIVVATHVAYGWLDHQKTAKPLALMVRQLATDDDIVASFSYDQTLPFYARRRIVVVGALGELEFGSKQGDQSAWFLDLIRFEKLWRGEKRVFLLLQAANLDNFRSYHREPFRVIGQTRTKVLIANH